MSSKTRALVEALTDGDPDPDGDDAEVIYSHETETSVESLQELDSVLTAAKRGDRIRATVIVDPPGVQIMRG